MITFCLLSSQKIHEMPVGLKIIRSGDQKQNQRLHSYVEPNFESTDNSPNAQHVSRYVEYSIKSTTRRSRNKVSPDLFNSNVLKKYLSPSRGLILYILPTNCSRKWLKSSCVWFEPLNLYSARGIHLRALLFHVRYYGYSTYRIWRGFRCLFFFLTMLWALSASLFLRSQQYHASSRCYVQPLEKRTISTLLQRQKHILHLGIGRFHQ